MEQLVEQGRKNIEAVQAANQAVIDGWQAIAEKQADVFRETMDSLQKAMNEGLSGSTSESGERQAELAREGFETALENVRQLAEIATDSQTKAFEIMRERIEANMQAMLNRQASSDD
jgi:phasin family protein